MEEKNNPVTKKKPGLIKIIFKLITLGGLLVIVYRFFQNKDKKESDKK